jgi:hypothetical protein
MQTNIQTHIDKLNMLYHEIIMGLMGSDGYKGCLMLKNLAKKTRKLGYEFKPYKIDLAIYDLNEHESKVYSRMDFLRQEIRFGKENHLQMYTLYMGQCVEQLYSETFLSLYKREAIDKEHFRITGSLIDFRQSDDWVDSHVIQA